MPTIKPRVNEKEIETLIESIKSYWPDMTITEGHFKMPTSTFVYSFYSRFYEEYVKKFYKIRSEILNQEQEFDYQSLDETSLAIVLMKICRLFELTPFCLNDIYEPSQYRTFLYFKVFMNFLLYINTDESVEDLISEAQKSKNFQRLCMEKQELTAEIAHLTSSSNQVETTIKKIMKSIEDISDEYKSVMKQKAEKEKQYEEDIKLITKLKEQCQTLNDTIKRSNQDSDLYQQQIVDEAEVDQIKLKIEELEKKTHKLDMDRSEIVSTLEIQESTNKHFNDCFQLLRNYNFGPEYTNQLKLNLEQYAAQIREINKLSEDINDRKVEINSLQKEHGQLMEEYLALDKELPMVKIQHEEYIRNLKEENDSIIRSLDAANILETAIEELERNISDKKEERSILVSTFLDKYNTWIDNLAGIHHLFNEVLVNIHKKIEEQS